MTKVLYPGSFNPLTKGHMEIIEKSSELFEEVIIAILINPLKKTELFSLEERESIIKDIYKDRKNIKVISSYDTAVDVALKYNCQAIIRGIRNLKDFDYEEQLQYVNKEISHNKINTIFLFSSPEYKFLSSSIVRELFSLKKDISPYVDSLVLTKMQEKEAQKK